MKNVLIVSGHTDLSNSVVNKTILEVLGKEMPHAEIDLLESLYPDYKIDVEDEQDKLRKADVIILQYPIFWYSMPSLIEKWMEDTFLYGFSHGIDGDKLKNKKLIVSFTTGAIKESYTKENYGFEIEDLLLSIKATCHLCEIEFAGYIYTCGVSYRKRTNPDDIKLLEDKAKQHVDRVMQMLISL